MSEPQMLMVDAVTAVLRDAGRQLRERGWPCELIVDRVPERDTFAVSLRIELPSFPIPIENAAKATGEAPQADGERGA